MNELLNISPIDGRYKNKVKDIIDFVNKLDIDEKDKKRLLELTPRDYIGLCKKNSN